MGFDFDVKIDSRLGRFSQDFTIASRKAEFEAVSRGAATGRKLMQGFIREGGEGTWDDTHALTKVMRASGDPNRPVLSHLANLIAFQVTELNSQVVADVGHTPFRSKKKQRGVSNKAIARAYEGWSRTFTKEDQESFRLRLWKRFRLRTIKGGANRTLKRVAELSGGKLVYGGKRGIKLGNNVEKYRQLTAAERVKIRAIMKFMPKKGTVITAAPRPMPKNLLAQHGDEISRKMTETYLKWMKAQGITNG